MQVIDKPSKYDIRYHNMVSAILKADGAQKWRLAAAAYLHLNKSDWDPVAGEYISARESTARVLAEVKRERTMQANKFASGDGIRQTLRMPPGMLAHIELFDPEVIKTKGGLHKLCRAFPQFCLAERI